MSTKRTPTGSKITAKVRTRPNTRGLPTKPRIGEHNLAGHVPMIQLDAENTAGRFGLLSRYPHTHSAPLCNGSTGSAPLRKAGCASLPTEDSSGVHTSLWRFRVDHPELISSINTRAFSGIDSHQAASHTLNPVHPTVTRSGSVRPASVLPAARGQGCSRHLEDGFPGVAQIRCRSLSKKACWPYRCKNNKEKRACI
jgi:hypothetical protein